MYWIQQYLQDDSIHPLASLAATYIYDGLRHTNKILEIHEQYLNLYSITSSTLQNPILSNYIMNLSFFTPLANISHPLLHLLSKCLKIRDQNRTFPPLIRKYLITRIVKDKNKQGDKLIIYDSLVFQTCKQIVLCVLLGNFPDTIPSSRPLKVRSQLYQIFETSRFDRWIVRLFHHCWSVYQLISLQ